MQTIIMYYCFWVRYIGYLFMLPNTFSQRHHCKTQSEAFDTLEKCRDCLMFLQGADVTGWNHCIDLNIEVIWKYWKRITSILWLTKTAITLFHSVQIFLFHYKSGNLSSFQTDESFSFYCSYLNIKWSRSHIHQKKPHKNISLRLEFKHNFEGRLIAGSLRLF